MHSSEAYLIALEGTEKKLQQIYQEIRTCAENDSFEGTFTVETGYSQFPVIIRHLQREKYDIISTVNEGDGKYSIHLKWDTFSQEEREDD
jgi:hypothetical protein